jgi:predicted nicotinamide N-methyase
MVEEPPRSGEAFLVKEDLSRSLSAAVAGLIPGATLRWYTLPASGGMRGFFLEEESALRPLPADKVEAVMQDPPYWALLWPSGERLCRLLAAHSHLVRGRSVLDFGCGCGLVASAAAREGAAKVWAVDIDPLALTAARLNALENCAKVETRATVGDGPVDLLLVADFLYDNTHLPLFDSLQERAREVLVLDSRLSQLGRADFLFLGESLGKAVPDLDPHREFGRLRFWYRGGRDSEWRKALEGC